MDVITHYADDHHRQGVIALWNSVFGPQTAHREPALAIDKKRAMPDGLFFVAVADATVIGTVLAGYDGHRGLKKLAPARGHSDALGLPSQRRFAMDCLSKTAEQLAKTPEQLATDEAFWAEVASRYPSDDGPINLDNGYFGRMSHSVVRAYESAIDQVNRSNAVYVRGQFDRDEGETIRQHLAELMGVPVEELAFARSATEALYSLIRNYNRLQPGDQVLTSDLDYPAVQSAFRWLQKARGVEVIEVVHEHPASHEALLRTYSDAFAAHPRLKLMAMTHVTHRTGLVMPVKAIARMAKARGIDVILDGAHSLGQLEVDLNDLGIEFAGFNLQKWIGAPLSLGVIHVRRGRLGDLDPDMGNLSYPSDDIRCLSPYGTPNVPALLALPTVFAEHRALGGWAVKGARLRYLRDAWVSEARQLPGIEVLTPDDPRLYCGLGAFRFVDGTDPRIHVERLLREFNLFTVLRDGSACGPCVRVTPGVSSSVADMRALVAALRVMTA